MTTTAPSPNSHKRSFILLFIGWLTSESQSETTGSILLFTCPFVILLAVRRALARDDAAQRQHLHWNLFQFAPPRDLPLRVERSQAIRLKDRIHLRAVAQLLKSAGANASTLPSHNRQQPDVLPLRQTHPKIIIHRHQGRALLDGRHRVNQDAIYGFFAERLKESAERAILRLKWHRSWGDMAKNSACCQRSASSMPRAPASRR